MKVAFCTLPLQSGHKIRGVGYYTENILENLKKRGDIEIEEFEDISKVKSVDLVHFPWFDLFQRTLPLKKKFPTVVTIHDVIPLLYPVQYPPGVKGKINFQIQKLALKNCKYIITVSEASKKDIVKFLSIKDEKIEVIYEAPGDGFKISSDTNNLRTKRKFNLPDRFLLYVGDANFNKNTPFLIKGFKLLKSKPEFKDLKLVLVGSVFLKKPDNIEHLELKSLKQALLLIKEYQFENEVLRVGQLNHDDLVSFYNLASVYVQPSLYEGFGLPILEAMSCGTPVVSSETPSLKEVGGDAALYFDPLDLGEFVECLTQVLQNTPLQDKLSKLGLKQASLFSWEKVIDETAVVYRKVFNR